jgi:hypothetical protein
LIGCEFVNFPTKRTEKKSKNILCFIENVPVMGEWSLCLFNAVREQNNLVRQRFQGDLYQDWWYENSFIVIRVGGMMLSKAHLPKIVHES